MRLTLMVAMLAIVTAVSAQTSLGIKGGVNMSNFYGDELDDRNVKIGFHVGVAADYEFMYNHAIQTGLFFTTKGAKYQGEFGSVTGEVSLNPMYLQLPVHYAYKIDVSPGTRVVLHAGPYVAYGIGGKANVTISSSEGSSETDGVDIFGEDGFDRFDAGLGLGVGAEFGRFLVDLGWDMGLVNISGYSEANVKNQNAYLSVGYKF